MTKTAAAAKAIEKIGPALQRQDWAKVTAAAERLLELAVRSVATRDATLLRDIGTATADFGTIALVRSDVEPGATAATTATLLKAVAAVAEVGRRGTPRAEDKDARGQIIECLVLSGSHPMTNTELARVCDKSVETISRVLKPLRKEGLVLFRSAGRQTQNWISEKGRQFYERDGAHYPIVASIGKRDASATENVRWQDLLVLERLNDQEEVIQVHQLMDL